MKFARVLSAVVLVWGAWMSSVIPSAVAETSLGAQAPEGEPSRRQLWVVPSFAPNTSARATLFRPTGDGPFPLAIIASAETTKVSGRTKVAGSEYRTLANWLVARGYAVLVTEPLGQGRTGGLSREDQGACDDASYLRAGRATADSIVTALNYMRGQTFVRPDGDLIVGHSAGGWGALALASRDLSGVSAVIAFAPGRADHSHGKARQVCPSQHLIAAAAELGKDAHLPVVWMVARNDSHFPPLLSRQMADAFRAGGDRVDFRALPDFRSEGHSLAEADGGDEIYGATLDSALKAITARPVHKR